MVYYRYQPMERNPLDGMQPLSGFHPARSLDAVIVYCGACKEICLIHEDLWGWFRKHRKTCYAVIADLQIKHLDLAPVH